MEASKLPPRSGGVEYQKPRRVAWTASVVIVLALGLYLVREWAFDQFTDESVGAYELAPEHPNQEIVEPEKIPFRDGRKESPNQAKQGWVAVEPESVDPSRIPSYKETVMDAVLVALDEEIWSWQAGDRVVLTVPQVGASYDTVIDRVDAGLGNNRTYVGRLVEGELPHSFVITVGDRNAFAYLGTPYGSYELVGNTELAWLMPTANLDQHVDYSKPDFYLVEPPVYFIQRDPATGH